MHTLASSPNCPQSNRDTVDSHRLFPKHWNELINGSKIAPSLASLNFESFKGKEALEAYLGMCEARQIKRTNPGFLASPRSYAYLEDGLWLCSGNVDPLTGELMGWSQVKPDHPKEGGETVNGQWVPNGKPVKYVSPRAEGRAYFLQVPLDTWQKIADRSGLSMPEDPHPCLFWRWVRENSIPIMITEGVKKAAAALSAGYAAIALPGISMGYRSKDKDGNPVPRYLIPDLELFAISGRTFIFAFDQDSKLGTRRNVNLNTFLTAMLLQKKGCRIRVANWEPEQGKGLDDLIVKCGVEAFDEAIAQSKSFASWKNQWAWGITHPIAQKLNTPNLDSLEVPEDERFIFIKSGKGTGKTKFLVKEIKKAIRTRQRTLVIVHRVQLGIALAKRFGLNYIESKDETGTTLGIVLCIDSLHPGSIKSRFNPCEWEDALVVFDEIEQILFHLFNSQTDISKHRLSVLKTLKRLIERVLHPDTLGRLIACDADLSDASINFLRNLAGYPIKPYLVENIWKPNGDAAWDVFMYAREEQLWAFALTSIQEGKRVLITTTAQKASSKLGTKTMERQINRRFSDKKTLRVDSETVVNPEHPAYGSMEHINETLVNYDVVLMSPVGETGISIDLEGHFDLVIGFSSGQVTVNGFSQSQARLRAAVPHYIHVPKTALPGAYIGSGAYSREDVIKDCNTKTQAALNLFSRFDRETAADVDRIQHTEDPDLDQALDVWAWMAARHNAMLPNYRGSIADWFEREGHCIHWVPDHGPLKELKQEIKQNCYEAYLEERVLCSNAEPLSTDELKELEVTKERTDDQRYRERKTKLLQRYPLEVTPQLVLADDQGLYRASELRYYLTVGADYLKDREKDKLSELMDDGRIWRPDLNRKVIAPMVKALKRLGIDRLLKYPDRLWTKNSKLIRAIAYLAKAAEKQIKLIFGMTIGEQADIQIVRRLLELIGYAFTSQRSGQGKRERIYRLVQRWADIDYERLSDHWLEWDLKRRAELKTATPINRSLFIAGMAEMETSTPIHDPSPAAVTTTQDLIAPPQTVTPPAISPQLLSRLPTLDSFIWFFTFWRSLWQHLFPSLLVRSSSNFLS